MRSFPGLIGVGEIQDLTIRLALQTIEEWARQVRWEETVPTKRKLTKHQLSTSFVTTYDDDPTSAASQAFQTYLYDQFCLIVSLTKTAAPGSLEIKAQVSDDATNWYDPTGADLDVTIVAADIPGLFYLAGPVTSDYMRFYATANGTGVANKITVASASVYFGGLGD